MATTRKSSVVWNGNLLESIGEVPGLDKAGFEAAAQAGKEGCPVSQALKEVPIKLVVV